MKKALVYGILSSLFFASTFILNRSMHLSGGYWMWSASLRYLFTLPMLAVFLWRMPGKKFKAVFDEIRKQPLQWFLWSTVGFGFFYLPQALASVYGESWMVAACWQVTIVAGVLLTPLFGKKVPVKNLLMSCLILAGIFVLQIPNLNSNNIRGNVLALFPIIIAAFSYPLGNRKMMQYCPDEIDTTQRVFGMTLCSMPFWIVVSVIACIRSGLPSYGQLLQSSAVALFSGVVATILFFKATDLVKNNARQLAVVEATQCGEVVFTLIGGVLLLGDAAPGFIGTIGIVLIVVGMVASSLMTSK